MKKILFTTLSLSIFFLVFSVHVVYAVSISCVPDPTSVGVSTVCKAIGVGSGDRPAHIIWYDGSSTLQFSDACDSGSCTSTHSPGSVGTWTVNLVKDSDSSIRATTTLTVSVPLTCESYTSSESCEADTLCDWCTSCSGNQYSGGADRCVNTGTCSYFCEYSPTPFCSATCEQNSDCTDTSRCSGTIYQTRTASCLTECSCSYDSWTDGTCTQSVTNCGAACDEDSDCDDSNIHTTDTCNLGTCSCEHVAIPTCGITVSPPLAFENLYPENISTDQSTVITNTGTDPTTTVLISGIDWTTGINTFSVGQTKWSTSSGQDYETLMTALTSTPTDTGFDVSPGSPQTIYFKLKIPADTLSGTYSQTITFTSEC